MTDLLPSTGKPSHDLTSSSNGSVALEGRASRSHRRRSRRAPAHAARPRHVGAHRRPDVRARVRGRRRGRAADRRRGTRRPEDPSRRRRPGGAYRRCARSRSCACATADSLATPVPTGNGTGTLQIEINNIRRHLLIEHGLDPSVPDNRIIGAAIGQSRLRPDHDGEQRRRAADQGRPPRRERRRAPADAQRSQSPGGRLGDDRHDVRGDRLPLRRRSDRRRCRRRPRLDHELRENEFAVLRCGSQSALVRSVDDEFVLLPQTMPEAWGLRPRSKEQRFALELLLDPDISVIALDGRAGTGKTILAIAAGLEQVVEHGAVRTARRVPPARSGRARRRRLPAGWPRREARPVDGGDPRLGRGADRPRQHQRRPQPGRRADDPWPALARIGHVPARSLAAAPVRGRSTRPRTSSRRRCARSSPASATGTKVIFTGDTSQIDAPYLGESNNALSVLASAFRGQTLLRPHHADRL